LFGIKKKLRLLKVPGISNRGRDGALVVQIYQVGSDELEDVLTERLSGLVLLGEDVIVLFIPQKIHKGGKEEASYQLSDLIPILEVGRGWRSYNHGVLGHCTSNLLVTVPHTVLE
jgi:hypothetical protein